MDGDGRIETQTGDSSGVPAAGWDATPRTSQAQQTETVVELHHDAGLTAGHTLGLRPGKFRLGPRKSSDGGLVAGAPEAVSFDLVITPEGETTLNAGSEPVAVEGVVVDRPVHLEHGDVVQLRTDHFVLRSLTSPPRRRSNAVVTPRTVAPPSLPSMSGWLWLFALVALFGLIVGFIRSSLFGLILIGLGGIVGTLIVRSRRHNRSKQEHARQLSNARSLFFNEILSSRKAAADSLRSEANTPATVTRRASEAPQKHGLHLHVTVASGDRSWEPRVVCHRESGWNHQAVVDELSFLPAIPFTVDLDTGPIAVVGPRLATLAVARHIATSALVASPSDTGVSVTTSVPADWRWLPSATAPVLHILDSTTGPLEKRTVVLAPSVKALGNSSAFTHILKIDKSGGASIRQSNGQNGDGFAPHGITEKQARDIVQIVTGTGPVADQPEHFGAIDLRDAAHEVLDTSRLLVTGPERARTKNVLATAALRQAARYPDRSIFILDRGDRALIRLAQLEACQRYVAIDQIENVDFMVSELETLEAQSPESQMLLLAPDLWDATAFYRNSGRVDLADRIDRIVARMEIVPMAATATDATDLPQSSFLVWVDTDTDTTHANVTQSSDADAEDSLTIDLDTLPGIDLTASVARLSTSFDEETRS